MDKKTNTKLDPIVSFYFSNTNQLYGKIQIGGYDVKKYGKEGLSDKDIIWSYLVQNDDYFWTLSMNKARLYGGKPLKSDQIYGDINMSSK